MHQELWDPRIKVNAATPSGLHALNVCVLALGGSMASTHPYTNPDIARQVWRL